MLVKVSATLVVTVVTAMQLVGLTTLALGRFENGAAHFNTSTAMCCCRLGMLQINIY